MKVSVNLVKQYLDFELPPIEELVTRIGAQLGGVEGVENIGEKYKGAVVVKVVSCEPHPDSDHMHVCRIDDGGKTPDVQRGEDGLVQVVCGAPNVRAGLSVVWLPPGSTVPESYDKDPFVLGARELRGVTSNGMLASARELALGESHDGILVVDDDKQPGTSLAEAYQLDDYIIDIENKMFTHRPDCFGQLGIAREIAGILGKPFKSPAWYQNSHFEALAVQTDKLPLTVHNEVPSVVPRFMAVAMSGVTVKPSPLELQTWLLRLGVRPISNIVDMTNYIMLLTGQPLHAYDYDKVAQLSDENGPALFIRYPRQGEQILLLNGKTITPRPEAVMIATAKQLIGVGGAMGGGDTEVDDNTKNIILEVATFDMYSIRRTSMAHGIFTEAVSRFNKGQSPLQNDEVLAYAMQAAQELSSAVVAGDVIDNNHVNELSRERRWVHPPVPVSTEFINSRLGLALTPEDMKTLLENVEFQVAVEDGTLTVTAPFWRTDVETREDVVEEVGRLYGFDKLPLVLPQRSIKPVAKDQLLEFKERIRSSLAQAGGNEVLNYSFVHGDLLERSGQDKEQAFQVGNALSPDLQYYRMSITPSLLEKVHMNSKAGYDEFALFELGKAHAKGDLDQENLPAEYNRTALVYAANDKTAQHGAAYYKARTYATNLLRELGATDVTFEPYNEVPTDATALAAWLAPFAPGRSAYIEATIQDHGRTVIGIVGEYKPSVSKALKLPKYCAGFELDTYLLQVLSDVHDHNAAYVPLPRFPKVSQDITLKVTADVPYQQLYDLLITQLEQTKPQQTYASFVPLSIYQREDDANHKQFSFRLEVASYERTLTDKEVATLLGLLANAAKEKFAAEQI